MVATSSSMSHVMASLLSQDDGKPFPKPRPKTSERELVLAREYFEKWHPDAGELYDD